MLFKHVLAWAVLLPTSIWAENPHPATVEFYLRDFSARPKASSQVRKDLAGQHQAIANVLGNPSLRPLHRAALEVLSALGTAEAGSLLIQFIESGPTVRIADEDYYRRSAAIVGLGKVVFHSGDSESLNYLLAAVRDVSVWNRRLKWSTEHHQGELGPRNRALTRRAIQGLGYSRTPEAVEALSRAKQECDSRPSCGIRDVVSDALARLASSPLRPSVSITARK